MGTLADLLIPLAGSISNEKALKMREACDALEGRVADLERARVDVRERLMEMDQERDHADTRIDDLERVQERHRKGLEFIEYERVSPLEDRVSMLEAATKNIAVATDETLRAVRLNAGEGGVERSPQQHIAPGDAERSDRPSPASVPEWVPSETELESLWRTHPVGGEFAAMRRLISSRAPAAPVADAFALTRSFCIGLWGERDEFIPSDVSVNVMTRALAAQGVKCEEVQP